MNKRPLTDDDDTPLMLFQDDPPPSREPGHGPMDAVDYLILAALFLVVVSGLSGLLLLAIRWLW